MAAFSGFRPFLTKGSTLNGVQNTFFTNSVNGVHYVPDAADVYSATSLATFSEGISAVLDEKNGKPVAGSNLIVNGDFSNGITGWGVNDPAAATIAVVEGRIKVTPLDTLSRWTWQSFPTVAGRTYELLFDYDSGTASSINFFSGSVFGSSNQYTNTVRTGVGTTKVLFVALSTTSWIGLGPSNNNSGKESFFDNISVQEYPGLPAIQTSTSLRPLFGRAPVSRRNILTRTEDFVNWTNTGSTTITLGNVAPNGTNTSSLLGSASSWELRQNPIFSGTGTFSVYAKKSVGSSIIVLCVSQVAYRATFNFDTQQFSNVGSNIIATSYESLPDGWYRISIVGSNLALTGANGPGVAGSAATYAYIWGPQFETGSVATAYQKVGAATDMTESGVTAYPFIRMDLSDDVLTTNNIVSTKNLLRFTEEFDNAAWFKQYSNTVISNAAIAPDGTLSADKLIERAATQTQRFYQQITAPSTPTVFSVYMKQAERTWALLEYTNGAFAFFNLATGEIGTIGGTGITANISSAANGFYRCEIRASTQAICECRISVTTGNSVFSYLGDGTSGIFLWGAQFEAASTATTYEYGGFKGTALVAGRSGTSIDTVTLPNGVFSLGPTTYTGGSPGILRAVGDIVGYTLTGKTTTSIEQDLLIDFYKFRGAKGRLSTGPELIVNGTFDTNTTMWTPKSNNLASCTFTSVNGRGYLSSPQSFHGYEQVITGLTPNVYYKLSFDIEQISGAAISISILNSFNTGPFPASNIIVSSSSYLNAGVKTLEFLLRFSSQSSTLTFSCGDSLNLLMYIDNVSLRAYRPKEEL